MSGFERKINEDGSPNPKYIDLCDEDPPISGQKFACMSFVSPERILKQRENYIFEQFVKEWDFTKSMTKMSDFVNFVSYKYKLMCVCVGLLSVCQFSWLPRIVEKGTVHSS